MGAFTTSKCVVFTDLDGTLLEEDTYAFDKTLPYLEGLKNKGVPIVFCSAKTRAEQEVYRQRSGIRDPFVVENGNAVFIEEDYFDFRFPYDQEREGYLLLEYGISYDRIREALQKVRSVIGVNFKGYGDMNAAEVASATGLEIEEAGRAKRREYEETITTQLEAFDVEKLQQALQSQGLRFTRGGRFFSVSAHTDKGRAVQALSMLYRRTYGSILTIGIGDSWNDVSMLSMVDIAFLVQKPGETWEEIDLDRAIRVEGVGPYGWVNIAKYLLDVV
jgi:mannosyl-3-phosphoglycerate phosphatase